MDSTSPESVQANKPATAFSCVRCFERKVKCDRVQPCAACTKRGAQCIYRVPPPPRRRKRRLQEDILTERLKRYEQVLQQQGIDPNEIAPKPRIGSTGDPECVDESDVPERRYAISQLMYNSGRSHYVENNLWNRVREEIETSNETFDGFTSSEEDSDIPQDDNVDFMLSVTPSMMPPRLYHPPPEQVLQLWQIFLENVNPLSKVIHYPTLQVTIQHATSNLNKVPRGLEALMFAIYSGAVLSLKDEECEHQFGETKKTLLSRYRAITKVALARAKFMGTSDLVVLQALALHLLTTRDEYDPRTLWVLTGVAMRIGESMGLHRDGTVLGLPFFESEMRRRLFWQLAMLDYRSAELSGSARFRSMFHEDFTVQIPLNIDDDEICPGMTNPPLPTAKASEMIFCSLRYEFGRFWAQKQGERARKGKHDEHLWANYASLDKIAEKDKDIDELQQMIQTTYVRYCDPMVPAQLMASLVAIVAIASMRLVAHHPRRYSKEDDVPEREKELLWTVCLKLLEGDGMAYTDHKLQRFTWHTSFYFQWQAIIHVLDCLRAQPFMLEANRAWQLIEDVYEHRPEFITDTKKPIHVAVGTLCLKAYNAREQAQTQTQTQTQDGVSAPSQTPGYIIKLRQQREAAHKKQTEAVAAKFEAQQLGSSGAASLEQTPNSFQRQQSYVGTSDMSPDSMAFPSYTPSTSSTQQQAHQQQIGFDVGSNTIGDMAQQPNIWFDNFGYQDPISSGIDVELMMSQDGNSMDANANAIDWTQWDNLIPGFRQRAVS